MRKQVALAVVILVLDVLTASAQRLTATEISAGGAVAVARHTFAGAELGVAYRPGGQSRIGFAAAGGSLEGRAAARGQATLQFLVSPTARRGAGLYAGLGAAALVRRGSAGAGYVAMLIGLEAAPGRSGGRGLRNWYVELGLGGGVRAAAGWRWRSFPAWWSSR